VLNSTALILEIPLGEHKASLRNYIGNKRGTVNNEMFFVVVPIRAVPCE